MLFDPDRHEALCATPWSEAAARSTIRAIVDHALRSVDPATLWPIHPRDAADHTAALPVPGLYDGAAGVIWALQRLAAQGAADVDHDFDPVVAGLHEHSRRFTDASGVERPCYFLGESGVLLMQWAQFAAPATADALFAHVRGNLRNPTREALWGSPGTLIAALHMWEATQEPRWLTVFREGVAILWEQMHTVRHTAAPDRPVWVWTQDMNARQRIHLGAGHGLAGNVYPAVRGARWLDDDVVAGFESRAFEALDVSALREAGQVNWEPVFDHMAAELPSRKTVQDCHGAAGIVSRLAGARSPALQALLLQAGELVWAAGPLTKPPGLCHGTDGNGYAFLKLHAMTGEQRWLDRARSFAMHAMRQSDALLAQHGQRRFTLWTGDLGLATYLWACITADPSLPALDVF